MAARDAVVIVAFDIGTVDKPAIRLERAARRSDPMRVMQRELEAKYGLSTTRRRALLVITIVTVGCLVLLGDLLVVGHTRGEEVWGVATALGGVVIGALSLIFLTRHGQSRVARLGLIALWVTVALFGLGGYNSHRLPLPEGTIDPRPRPPVAPLVFTGFGIAGALAVRFGSKGE